MSKEKINIYPFDKEFLDILRNSSKFKENYEINKLISPRGWGYCGKDAGMIDYGEVLGLTVESSFEGNLDECDTVIFTKPNKEVDYEEIIKNKIDLAIEKNKNIICLLDLEDEEINRIRKKCNKNKNKSQTIHKKNTNKFVKKLYKYNFFIE